MKTKTWYTYTSMTDTTLTELPVMRTNEDKDMVHIHKYDGHHVNRITSDEDK